MGKKNTNAYVHRNVPLVSVDDPESVRMRIAQENLERLINLKREQMDGVSAQLSRMCDEVLSYTYFVSDVYLQQREQKRRQDQLISFAKGLGLDFNLMEVDNNNLGEIVGNIRAALFRWKRQQLAEIASEVESLLSKRI